MKSQNPHPPNIFSDPFTNQSKLFQSKNWERPLCPAGFEATHLCLNPKCKQYAKQSQKHSENPSNSFICSNGKCEVCFHPDDDQLEYKPKQLDLQRNHQKCVIMKYTRILNCIQNKLPNINPLKGLIDKIFDDFIDYLSDLRQKYLNDIKYCGLSSNQQKFLICFQEKNYEKINPQLSLQIVNQLQEQNNVNVFKIKQNLQSYWKEQATKVKCIFQFIGEKLLRQGFKSQQTEELKEQKAVVNEQKKIEQKIDSKIAVSDKEKQDLKIMLESQQSREILELVLLYRASENNFSAIKFHQKCDNTEHTLTLIETQYNKKIGGYTPLKWDSRRHGICQEDSTGKSFVFSLTNNHKFILTSPEKAIFNFSFWGPTFGGGPCDIHIVHEANLNKNSFAFIGSSYNNYGYKYNDQESWKKFSGAVQNYQFLIKQWEVFRVVWK